MLLTILILAVVAVAVLLGLIVLRPDSGASGSAAPDVVFGIPNPPDSQDDSKPRSGGSDGIAKDGIFAVGEDVKPGRYKTAGGVDCSFYVYKDANTGGSPVIGESPGGQAYVVLKSGQYFQTNSCGVWQLQ